jgi:protease-4
MSRALSGTPGYRGSRSYLERRGRTAYGLVDELGGLDTALRLARRKAGLPPDAPVRVFPKVSPIDRIRPPTSSEDQAAAAVWSSDWDSFASMARSLGLPATGPLTMPGYRRLG